jgi:small-conductance mechanosensitive channel
LFACLFAADASLAQSDTAGTVAAPATPAPDLSALKTQIEAAADLPEDDKARALDYYARTVQAVADGDRAVSEYGALQSRIDSAAARIAALHQQIENPPAPAEIPADSSVEKLQALGSQMKADFQATLDAVNKLEAEKAEFVQGSNSLVETIVEKERGLRRIGEKLAAPPAVDEPAVVRDAGRAYLRARQRFEEADLKTIRLRAFNADLLFELISRERDAALARVSVSEAQMQKVDELLQSAREKKARAGRWEAALALASSADLPEPVAAVAKRNSDRKVELQKLLGQEAALNAALRDANSRLRQLRGNLTTLRERVATYGASSAIGRFLQRRLKKLPSVLDYHKQARIRRDAFTEVTDRRIDVEDQREALSDIDSRADAVVASIEPAPDAADTDKIRKQTAELLKVERDTLRDLGQAYDRYMS